VLDNVPEIWYIVNMDVDTCLIYSGLMFTLEWYYDKGGKSVVREYYLERKKEGGI